MDTLVDYLTKKGGMSKMYRACTLICRCDLKIVEYVDRGVILFFLTCLEACLSTGACLRG
jgi:hypothetical protein